MRSCYTSLAAILLFLAGCGAGAAARAMEMAGLDQDTPDTGPGLSCFERDAEGNPTGYIVNAPAQVEIFKKFVTIGKDYIRDGMARWFPDYWRSTRTTLTERTSNSR